MEQNDEIKSTLESNENNNLLDSQYAIMHNGNAYIDENNLTMADKIFGEEEVREYGITD